MAKDKKSKPKKRVDDILANCLSFAEGLMRDIDLEKVSGKDIANVDKAAKMAIQVGKYYAAPKAKKGEQESSSMPILS